MAGSESGRKNQILPRRRQRRGHPAGAAGPSQIALDIDGKTKYNNQ